MAGIRIEGNTSGFVAEVDSSNNLKTTLPTTASLAGFNVLGGEVSTSAAPAGRVVRAIRTSAQGRLAVESPVCAFSDTFVGTAMNSALWTQVNTTMTTAVTGGFAVLNSGSSITTTQDAQIKTVQSFGFPSDAGLFFECECIMPVVPQANNEVLVGFFAAVAGAIPTDGAYFQWDSTGVLRAVIMNNTVATTSAALTSPTVNQRFALKIEVEDDQANFFINGILQAVVATGTGIARPFLSAALPWSARVRNTGAVGTAQQLKVGAIYVGWQDWDGDGRPGHHTAAYRGEMLHQGQTGGTMGSTANYANSANPTAAVPTNTTAALATGLGGQFWETDTLAVGTDGIIQSFQVPAYASTLVARTLMITGVTIDSFVQTAITAGGYMASWSLAFGHSAVSLATAETLGTSKGPRRVPLGLQFTPAAAAVLTGLTPISVKFEAPIAVHPGEFVQCVKKKAVGLVPGAGVIAHLITFDGYWI